MIALKIYLVGAFIAILMFNICVAHSEKFTGNIFNLIKIANKQRTKKGLEINSIERNWTRLVVLTTLLSWFGILINIAFLLADEDIINSLDEDV